MRYFKYMVMLLIVATLTFIACGGDSGSDGGGTTGDTVINIASIDGVTPPNYGETPVTAIT